MSDEYTEDGVTYETVTEIADAPISPLSVSVEWEDIVKRHWGVPGSGVTLDQAVAGALLEITRLKDILG